MSTDSSNDESVIRLINTMLSEAIRNDASVVHIEQAEHNMSFRYTYEDVLNRFPETQQQAAAQVIQRIKFMAKFDTTETQTPQDALISLRVEGKPVDVRVSILPSSHGEQVAMHLL